MADLEGDDDGDDIKLLVRVVLLEAKVKLIAAILLGAGGLIIGTVVTYILRS